MTSKTKTSNSNVFYSSVTKGKNFHTTVPMPVSKILQLEHKCKLSWELKVEDNKIFFRVKKKD